MVGEAERQGPAAPKRCGALPLSLIAQLVHSSVCVRPDRRKQQQTGHASRCQQLPPADAQLALGVCLPGREPLELETGGVQARTDDLARGGG